MNNSLPRVLVISSSTFSKTNNNGKTLSSFFANYDADKIAQFSFSNGEGNFDVCRKYYILSLGNVLKKTCGAEKILEKEVKTDENISAPQTNSGLKYKLFHHFSLKRLPFTVFFKNLLWERADYSAAMKWIEGFNPQIVFFQGFSMKYGYKFALKVCKKLNIPMILELTDDYTESLYKCSLFQKYNHKSYLKYFKEAIKYAVKTVVISPKMKNEYEKSFEGNFLVMMNSVPVSEAEPQKKQEAELTDFIYAGNVLLNRWKVLKDFAIALNSVNDKATLSVYTPDIPPENILNEFSEAPNIHYGGRLNSTELAERMACCSAVVHVEAFDKLNSKITRLSLSTKIPEYMSSGALIVAIGPKDISSMEYLKENEIAYCITDNEPEKIHSAVEKLYSPNFDRQKYIDTALRLCRSHHSIDKNAEIIKQLIVEACN